MTNVLQAGTGVVKFNIHLSQGRVFQILFFSDFGLFSHEELLVAQLVSTNPSHKKPSKKILKSA